MRPTLILAATAGFAALPILCTPAWALANRTFVSGSGSDANPCTLAAPCRSFAQAITQTNAGGEIVVLDSAGYGSVTITKSISINAPDGIEGGVTTASATDAIDINIGAGDVVNLRGLTLVGGGVGVQGIQFAGLGALNIQNCVIRGFGVIGLAFVPAGSAAFNVSDTIVSSIGTNGIAVAPSGSGMVTALFNRVQVIGSGDTGFLVNGDGATGLLNVTIANSAASNNTNIGIEQLSANGQAATQLMVVNTVVSNNGMGVLQEGFSSTIYLARNTIAGNGTAFSSSGALFSFGDNDIKSNGNDGGAIPLVSTK